jgi:NADPH:quinone reductase-like Zn-dependent oxidoreductase
LTRSGGDRVTDSLRSLAPEGRLVVVGFSGGEIPVVKVNRLLRLLLDRCSADEHIGVVAVFEQVDHLAHPAAHINGQRGH